ncbi:MAG: hypothetical protein IPF82_16955 [Blastocatellia bacterium]|nr:hypothetical protein [Blastocatellia bacterium]
MNAFRSQRSRPGIVASALLVLVSSLVIPAEPAKAQSGCPGTPVYDTTPSPLTGIINTYYPGRASVAASATSILTGDRTGSTTALAAGNLALVIQMQDADINDSDSDSYGNGTAGGAGAGYDAINSTGRYEYIRVTSVSGSGASRTVNFTGTNSGGLNYSYRAGAYASGSGGNGQRSFQVIRVPQFEDAIVAAGLTALPWTSSVVNTTNGTGPTGGVLAFDVSGTLMLAGQTISVDGLGFRGGGGRELAGESSDTPKDSTAHLLVTT